jgi:6-phosphogluconolactonase
MMDEMTDQGFERPSSRRHFLKRTAVLALAHCALGATRNSDRRTNLDRTLAYVGTHTGAIGSGGNGEGIYLFETNLHTGELSHRKLAAKTPNPSWVSIHPSKKYLYAVNEVSEFHGDSGSVSAFVIDAGSGDLSPLNTVNSEGTGPAHLSIDASGKYAFVANYGGGSIAMLPILGDGSLGAAVDVHRDTGSLGSTQATNAPAGSFAISGHDAPHAHMICADPQNKFVLATDLGQDRIYVYRFDPNIGRLIPSGSPHFVPLPSGDGPRHFVFHPNGHWLYAIQEESSTIVFFWYDPATGSLISRQTVSALPSNFSGSSFASEILVSPDGRFIYTANRLHDTVAVFSIDTNGRLKYIGETSTLGDYPSHCKIDPNGRFLYVCNQHSDSITSFEVHRDSGLLTFTGQYTSVGSPGSIVFLA